MQLIFIFLAAKQVESIFPFFFSTVHHLARETEVKLRRVCDGRNLKIWNVAKSVIKSVVAGSIPSQEVFPCYEIRRSISFQF